VTAANVGFLTNKGVYPYDYVSSIDKFSESQLPPKSEFQTKITNTYKMFGKHLIVRQLLSRPLSQVRCILADVFENFHKTCLKRYKLEGDIGEYPIPQYCTKKWQIPKYCVPNRLNTDTAYFNYIYNWFRILMVASLEPRRLIISGIYAQRCPCFSLIFW